MVRKDACENRPLQQGTFDLENKSACILGDKTGGYTHPICRASSQWLLAQCITRMINNVTLWCSYNIQK